MKMWLHNRQKNCNIVGPKTYDIRSSQKLWVQIIFFYLCQGNKCTQRWHDHQDVVS